MSNCPGVKFSANMGGVKLSTVSNCPVSNCPGVKLSANMGGVKLSVVLNIKLSWCQIVPGPFMLFSDPLWPSDERKGSDSPATFHSKHFLARGQPNKTRQYNDDNDGDEVVAMVTRVENGFERRER